MLALGDGEGDGLRDTAGIAEDHDLPRADLATCRRLPGPRATALLIGGEVKGSPTKRQAIRRVEPVADWLFGLKPGHREGESRSRSTGSRLHHTGRRWGGARGIDRQPGRGRALAGITIGNHDP